MLASMPDSELGAILIPAAIIHTVGRHNRSRSFPRIEKAVRPNRHGRRGVTFVTESLPASADPGAHLRHPWRQPLAAPRRRAGDGDYDAHHGRPKNHG
jgi:hypothetical protein